VEGVLYEYPMQNILRTAKFLPTWGQVKAQTMPLTETQVGKNFAVLNIFFMGIFIETPIEKKIQILKLIFDTLLWT
jgi:hypothetical protein